MDGNSSDIDSYDSNNSEENFNVHNIHLRINFDSKLKIINPKN